MINLLQVSASDLFLQKVSGFDFCLTTLFHIIPDYCFEFVYQTQLTVVRERHGSHAVFTRNRFRIRRDHILEDAFNQLSALSEQDLRGLVLPLFLLCVLIVINLRVIK